MTTNSNLDRQRTDYEDSPTFDELAADYALYESEMDAEEQRRSRGLDAAEEDYA